MPQEKIVPPHYEVSTGRSTDDCLFCLLVCKQLDVLFCQILASCCERKGKYVNWVSGWLDPYYEHVAQGNLFFFFSVFTPRRKPWTMRPKVTVSHVANDWIRLFLFFLKMRCRLLSELSSKAARFGWQRLDGSAALRRFSASWSRWLESVAKKKTSRTRRPLKPGPQTPWWRPLHLNAVAHPVRVTHMTIHQPIRMSRETAAGNKLFSFSGDFLALKKKKKGKTKSSWLMTALQRFAMHCVSGSHSSCQPF